jgi:hypothetical protein
VKCEVKLFLCGPLTGLWDPRRLRLTEVVDNRHSKVVRLSALRTVRLYPQEVRWCSFLLEVETTPGLYSAAGRINDPMVNRTRDRPACGAVP